MLTPGRFFAFLLVTLFVSCGQQSGRSQLKEEWNSANDPLRFLPTNFERVFAALPKNGNLDKKPWSDSYWPTKAGGLGQRWNDSSISDDDNFKYKPYAFQSLRTMSQAELAKLSPAEKFDILTGSYDYPLLNYERGRTRPDAEGWEGLCHGWASAAMNFEEPKSVAVKNQHGIVIPFGAADVKALLDLYSGNFNSARYYFVADRCNIDISEHPEAANNPECRDVNAGTFHLVLTNKLGIQKDGFVADITRDLQVWNQPIHSFSTEIVSEKEGASPGAAPGTTREVTVKTQMGYIVESGTEWDAGASYNYAREYDYRLELNANDQIIGGTWLEEGRPDFIWMQETPVFYDMSYNRSVIRFSVLNDLYRLSAASEGIQNPAQQ